MRSDVVVVISPQTELSPSVSEAPEHLLVQAFIAQPAVEAFHEAILHRLSRGDVMPFDPALGAPAEDGVRGQLGSII